MTTKEDVKRMMNDTNQKLLYEDATYLEYENKAFGESIVFAFGQNGFLMYVCS